MIKSFLTVLSSDTALQLGGAALAFVLLLVLQKLLKNQAKAAQVEHVVETAVDMAEKLFAVLPGDVAAKTKVALSSLEDYLKAHDLALNDAQVLAAKQDLSSRLPSA